MRNRLLTENRIKSDQYVGEDIHHTKLSRYDVHEKINVISLSKYEKHESFVKGFLNSFDTPIYCG